MPLVHWCFGGRHFLRCSRRIRLIPGILFGLFYSVYLVRRLNGTPGKIHHGSRIRKLDGRPIGFCEAFTEFAGLQRNY